MKTKSTNQPLTYCKFCGNLPVTGDVPCAACRTILEGPLAQAYKRWTECGEEYRMCCGGLSSDKTHLHFHGKYFDDVYPKVTRGPRKGQEPRRGPYVAVEHGIDFYADFAQTYYIHDTGNDVGSDDYGVSVSYADADFWKHVAQNFDHAAEAAFNDDWLTCRKCDTHYCAAVGPCGCDEKGDY